MPAQPPFTASAWFRGRLNAVSIQMRVPITVLLLLMVTRFVVAGERRSPVGEFEHLWEGKSPDDRVDCFLYNKNGKLRFRFISTAKGRTLGDFTSVYEPLRATKPRATELASRVSVYWSRDSRHVVLEEPTDGDTIRGLIVVHTSPASVKQLSLPLTRLAAFLPKNYQYKGIEVSEWSDNRTFLADLFGKLEQPNDASEYTKIPLKFRVGKDGSITISNPEK